MEGSEKAGKAIWSNFRLLTAKAADETKEYFQNLSTSLPVELHIEPKRRRITWWNSG
ncbi:hypothetical protein Pst134EA_009691 [Puccinia striiformis f. sp. tritici]|uniref:hypothetical protein n=1 Tax=Puccinia striiformis f. sp. tritici TaxID=168172 RepID=UPI002008024C|nr:hypothetical protein Pst134EA_009691 [Puccinia striiformis f. sp. tritici]KAH9458494.1 hypothetical protein Pst134EB_010797 [Puccinia striiformis f. sp. tritici]KAH9469162.1 hypothetical protein Pst134EA_009691 [Puccinia striiformis f. sp. tritici]